MTDKPEREITVEDIIEVTKAMDAREYLDYVEIARDILNNLDNEESR